MPFSYDPSRESLCAEIAKDILSRKRKLKSFKILDCGVGAGLIARSLVGALKDKFDRIELIGLEIFSPYIERPSDFFEPNFHNLYDKIEIVNFQTWLTEAKTNSFNAVLFGDSIEHLNPEWAEDCLAHAIRVARDFVYISTTIGEFVQEPVNGNEYERHCIYWTREPYEKFGAEVLRYDEGSSTANYKFDIKKRKNWDKPIPQTREIQHKLGCHMFDKYGKEMIL
jgi:hypothetical protein